jgi:ribosomal protein S18 acetylase RimI-like enzyme
MALEDHGTEQAALPPRPAIDGSDIRKLTAEDVSTIATALARAFEDDPVMSWIFQRDSDRVARLEQAFVLFLRKIWLPQDECYAASRLFGAAIWLPPDKWHLGVGAQVRMLPSMITVVGRNLPRLFTVLNMIEKKHPKAPHYYLAVLGVEPEFQGRGFGGALMQPVLNRCDGDRVPAYLESSKRRNVALYERHGFKVVEELKLPKDGPPIWRMWRDPADVRSEPVAERSPAL